MNKENNIYRAGGYIPRLAKLMTVFLQGLHAMIRNDSEAGFSEAIQQTQTKPRLFGLRSSLGPGTFQMSFVCPGGN